MAQGIVNAPGNVYLKAKAYADEVAGEAAAAIRNYATYVVAASDSVNKDKADYVCDGTSDQTEINSAIAAAYNAGGGKVVLLEGTYALSYITMKSNVMLEGMGDGTILNCSSSSCGIYGSSIDYSRISGLHLISTASSVGTMHAGIYFSASTHCIIDNCNIEGFVYGVLTQSSSSYIRCTDCYITATETGLYYMATSRSTVINCIIKGETYGLYTNSSSNTFMNNQVGEAASYGIYCSRVRNIVKGNYISLPSGATGIYSGSYNIISGNCIYDYYSAGIGIYLDSAASNIIGNTIYGANTGIRATSAASYLLVIGNLMYGVTTGISNSASSTSTVESNMVVTA